MRVLKLQNINYFLYDIIFMQIQKYFVELIFLENSFMYNCISSLIYNSWFDSSLWFVSKLGQESCPMQLFLFFENVHEKLLCANFHLFCASEYVKKFFFCEIYLLLEFYYMDINFLFIFPYNTIEKKSLNYYIFTRFRKYEK